MAPPPTPNPKRSGTTKSEPDRLGKVQRDMMPLPTTRRASDSWTEPSRERTLNQRHEEFVGENGMAPVHAPTAFAECFGTVFLGDDEASLSPDQGVQWLVQKKDDILAASRAIPPRASPYDPTLTLQEVKNIRQIKQGLLDFERVAGGRVAPVDFIRKRDLSTLKHTFMHRHRQFVRGSIPRREGPDATAPTLSASSTAGATALLSVSEHAPSASSDAFSYASPPSLSASTSQSCYQHLGRAPHLINVPVCTRLPVRASRHLLLCRPPLLLEKSRSSLILAPLSINLGHNIPILGPLSISLDIARLRGVLSMNADQLLLLPLPPALRPHFSRHPSEAAVRQCSLVSPRHQLPITLPFPIRPTACWCGHPHDRRQSRLQRRLQGVGRSDGSIISASIRFVDEIAKRVEVTTSVRQTLSTVIGVLFDDSIAYACIAAPDRSGGGGAFTVSLVFQDQILCPKLLAAV